MNKVGRAKKLISQSSDTRSFIDYALTLFVPTLLISKKVWASIWSNRDNEIKIINIKRFSLCIVMLFTVSSIPIFSNPDLQPKSFWLLAKVGTAILFLFTFLLSQALKDKRAFYPLLIAHVAASLFMCYFQADSINYRPQTPYFYVPVFAGISILVLRANVLTSSVLFFLILQISNFAVRAGARPSTWTSLH